MVLFHSYVSLPEGIIIVQFQTRETGELDGMIELLVGGWPTSLKNMSSSVGMMTFPSQYMENNPNVPNHQPGYIYIYISHIVK